MASAASSSVDEASSAAAAIAAAALAKASGGDPAPTPVKAEAPTPASAPAPAPAQALRASQEPSVGGDGGMYVFMDIAIGGKEAGRLVFELFNEEAPKAAENFRQLCTGEPGFGYKGSYFHKIIPSFMCQGGDITNGNGTGGRSIYGTPFNEGDGARKHAGFGTLAMANSSADNKATSQFYVTTVETEWLDGKSVVFGKLVRGKHTLRAMESYGQRSGVPLKHVQVVACGAVA